MEKVYRGSNGNGGVDSHLGDIGGGHDVEMLVIIQAMPEIVAIAQGRLF